MSDNTTLHPTAMESTKENSFSDIEGIIADIRAGKMVIMVDDEKIKCNRLALLSTLRHLFTRVADISLLQ